MALIALLIPFCADVAWEGEAGDPDAPGRLRVRAGACGITLPVWEYPKPAPPPGAPSAPPKQPGPLRRLLAKLKARRAAARKPRPARPPRQKARLTLHVLRTLLQGAGRLTRAAFGALRITRIRLFWPVTGPEPDEAARAYGKANAWLYPTLGALSHFLYLDFEELRLTPWLDPDAPAPAARVSFRVSARALFVLIAAVQVLIRFYRERYWTFSCKIWYTACSSAYAQKIVCKEAKRYG